jgi:lysophospholipase L1-like esterase
MRERTRGKHAMVRRTRVRLFRFLTRRSADVTIDLVRWRVPFVLAALHGLAWGCGAGRPAEDAGARPGEAPPAAETPASDPATAAAVPAPPREPVVNAESEAAHARAMQKFLGGGPPLPPLRDPEHTTPQQPGAFVPIVDPPSGPALARFHAALAALKAGEDPDGKVRVLMYGASGTASDLATGYLRTYLQSRFGDGGPGFAPLVPITKWYRHSEVVVSASKAWAKEHAQMSKSRLDGHWGLLGASFYTTKKRQRAEVGPKRGSASASAIAHAELWFLQQPGGGRFDVLVDGKKGGVVSTAAEAIGAGYHVLELPSGPHRIGLETRGDGEVRLLGAILERDEPGVVVDVLGIDGTRSANMLMWNEALWSEQARRRAPDLYVLSYGTNESIDEDEPIEVYEEGLRTIVSRFRRELPDASCLVLAPGDYPMKTETGWGPRPRLLAIHSVQKAVAAELGCGLWDGMVFMGGPGSMPAWVQADPPLARDDHLHFNGRGSARKAQALCDALMLQYDAAGE